MDNEKSLHAHKVILAARSAHLSAYLAKEDADIIEVPNNEILLPNSKRHSVQNYVDLVHYLYTSDYNKKKRGLSIHGKSMKTSSQSALEDIFGLMSLANSYNLSRLARICEHVISGEVLMNNAFYVLEHAELNSAHCLTEYCIWFIARNYSEMGNTLPDGAPLSLFRFHFPDSCPTGDEKERAKVTDLYQRSKAKIEEVKNLFKRYPHNVTIPQQQKKASYQE